MSDAFVLATGKQALMTALMVAAPVLIIGMIVGLIISIFQAVTQIQEQTLTFVPKILAVLAVFLVLGPWMLQTLVQFIQNMLNSITFVVR